MHGCKFGLSHGNHFVGSPRNSSPPRTLMLLLPSIIYYPLPIVYQFTTQVYKMDQKAQYTVLRIKRKATEPPLSSLGT